MASVRVTCPKCGHLIGMYGDTRVTTSCTSCKTKYTVETRNGAVTEITQR